MATITNPWVKAHIRKPDSWLFKTVRMEHTKIVVCDIEAQLENRGEHLLNVIEWLDETLIRQMAETITRQKEALEKQMQEAIAVILEYKNFYQNRLPLNEKSAIATKAALIACDDIIRRLTIPSEPKPH